MIDFESIMLRETRQSQRANPICRIDKFTEAKADSGWSELGRGGRELLLNGAAPLWGNKKLLETVGMVASHCECLGATELCSWNNVNGSFYEIDSSSRFCKGFVACMSLKCSSWRCPSAPMLMGMLSDSRFFPEKSTEFMPPQHA